MRQKTNGCIDSEVGRIAAGFSGTAKLTMLALCAASHYNSRCFLMHYMVWHQTMTVVCLTQITAHTM
jgi:hypothetical protein